MSIISGFLLKELVEDATGIWSVIIFPSDKLIVSGSGDYTIKCWNIYDQQDKNPITLYGHKFIVFRIAISYDEHLIVSGSLDLTIKIWSVDKRK